MEILEVWTRVLFTNDHGDLLTILVRVLALAALIFVSQSFFALFSHSANSADSSNSSTAEPLKAAQKPHAMVSPLNPSELTIIESDIESSDSASASGTMPDQTSATENPDLERSRFIFKPRLDTDEQWASDLEAFDLLVASLEKPFAKRLVLANFAESKQKKSTTPESAAETLGNFLVGKVKYDQVVCREMSRNIDLVPHSRIEGVASSSALTDFVTNACSEYDEIIIFDRSEKLEMWKHLFASNNVLLRLPSSTLETPQPQRQSALSPTL